jgi:hypothetical protein
MKQEVLKGFGTPYITGAIPPIDMPDDVVTVCQSESDAIRYSIQFAKRRFGYTQLQIAQLCGWSSDNHLSAYKKGRAEMPPKHWRRFTQVTACNLLEQFDRRRKIAERISGRECPNQREAAVVARMMAVAA